MRLILRKGVLMLGALALFAGIMWMVQGSGVLLTDDIISNDPRLFNPGIALAVGGLIAIIIGRKI